LLVEVCNVEKEADDGVPTKARDDAQNDTSDRVRPSSSLGIGVGVPQTQNAEHNGRGSHEEAYSREQRKESAIIRGQRTRIFVRDERRNEVWVFLVVFGWVMGRPGLAGLIYSRKYVDRFLGRRTKAGSRQLFSAILAVAVLGRIGGMTRRTKHRYFSRWQLAGSV
jgi:hypothetical protein